MTSKQSRITRLRQLIAQNRTLHLRAAADLLNVSEMTIRRDIRDNPTLFDTLGGHIIARDPPAPYDLGRAGDLHKASKKAACLHCLPLINAGDTIFIDCGTTLVHLVDMLPDDLAVTVICYAMNIADRTMRKPNVKLVLVGGEYHPKTGSFALLKDDRIYDSLAINTAFLSAAGFDKTLGATCSSFHEASQKRAAMARAQKAVLVIDESKFEKTSAAHFGKASGFDLILTETGRR
ncbi:MAG: DeoR/GlpR family DNA-binding transcription regulator [Rhodobacteraceae bacterium]|nr:DeoR/GlpR family DNA-binding transcription regulator [Paracoccaceae bacterium]